jgi:Response regulator receiver domain
MVAGAAEAKGVFPDFAFVCDLRRAGVVGRPRFRYTYRHEYIGFRGRGARLSPVAHRCPAGAPSPVTVLLVDDHAVVREGYHRLLARDTQLKVVGEAANSVEALSCDRKLEPDVTVLDIAMPGKPRSNEPWLRRSRANGWASMSTFT